MQTSTILLIWAAMVLLIAILFVRILFTALLSTLAPEPLDEPASHPFDLSIEEINVGRNRQ